MERLTSFQQPCNAQDECALFQRFPAEIRDRIYGFALSYYDDPGRLYPQENPYWRPDCLAPPKVECALLQTCQSIYNEAWFRPWTSMVHKLWLTAPDRAPRRSDSLTLETLGPMLQAIHQSHGKVETQELQVFPQLFALQAGWLQPVVALEHLYPLHFTITIRHTDWWFWESDERLRIDGKWVNDTRFPDSLQTINLELESLARKAGQIDDVANQVAEKWHFRTQDGTIFTARDSMQVSQWTGGSTWNRVRWVRDESKQPEKIEFYVKKVTWVRDRSLFEIPGGGAPDLSVSEDFKVIEDAKPALKTTELAQAGVPPGTSADEARRLVSEYLERARANGEYDTSVDDDDEDDENESGGWSPHIIHDHWDYEYDEDEENVSDYLSDEDPEFVL
jgi:hypothetical protein